MAGIAPSFPPHRILPLRAVLACGDAEAVLDPTPDEIGLQTIEIVDCDGRPVEGAPWRQAFREDGEYARLAEQVPGFGGLFLEGDRLAVHLVDLDTRDRAHPILRDYLSRAHPDLARLADDIDWLQGRYDWRQLVVWRSCLEGPLFAIEGIVSSDIDERRNRLVFGVMDDEARAAAEAEIAGTAVPSEAVILEERGPICPLPLLYSIVVEVRDDAGQPAAIGATVTIRKPGLEAQAEGFGDPLRVGVTAGNQGGVFEVRVNKPWHTEGVISEVTVPEGVCGVTEPAVVQATITLLPQAPPVRQVVLTPENYGFGASVCGTTHEIPGYVLTAPGVSNEAVWVSRDASVVTVQSGGTGVDGSIIGRITPACRATSGETWVVAMAAADPSVRDSVAASVGGAGS